MHLSRFACLVGLVCLLWNYPCSGAWVWIEGEAPVSNRMNRHPWWYDQTKRAEFSGGDFISNFSETKDGEAEYEFQAPTAGDYDFWVRANPLQAKLSYALNGNPEVEIGLDREQQGNINVAADDKPDLRFIAWSHAGHVALKSGANRIKFRMYSANNHHGYLDCFVFSSEPFEPRGLLKPDQMSADLARLAAENKNWWPFTPAADSFDEGSAIDLRSLNEKFAGEHGFIKAQDGNFTLGSSGIPVRFWAVNGPPHELKGAALTQCARMLAKHGVNLVRIHGGMFDERGEVAPEKVAQVQAMVAAMKAQGIYSHFSIYFPLWLQPGPDNPFLKGYDGKHHPFAALLFNPDFQAQYRKWWTALLTTPDPKSGKTLLEEPAVAGVELQNEDSFFFWTFSEQNLPEPQLQLLERRFGDWAAAKYGSIDQALTHWKAEPSKRDAVGEKRLGFPPIWNLFNNKTARHQDTVRFLYELQTSFYRETSLFLRKLGFQGLITPSNWTTASPEVLGPIEKLSYASGDFIDRHGYFSCNHKGDAAEWSIRPGHTYSDRSALRFDPEEPGKPKQFLHPGMDVHYNNRPSMISEVTWTRPNRYRTEAPLYLGCYGALQHSDGIVHFALDGRDWQVKPNYFMQPWTLMSPVMMGQFPAAALIYRRGLVREGAVVADIALEQEALFRLEGTPLPQDAALDELRLKDIPEGAAAKPGQRLDPLLFFAGRTAVTFGTDPSSTKLKDAKPFIDRLGQTVASTTGELKLDYGKGWLAINAAQAQGICGSLKAAGKVDLKDAVFDSELEIGALVLVSLDDQPLATSRRMLLQTMSEEKATGFETVEQGKGIKKIVSIGVDPWLVRDLNGHVRLKRTDASGLKVIPLDLNGYPGKPLGDAREIALQARTVYYLIEK